MEVTSRDVLTPLITGQDLSLMSLPQQRQIALWATKTALMATSPSCRPISFGGCALTGRYPVGRASGSGPAVLAHAALLAELLRLVTGVDVGELAFAARLATTEPEVAGNLAAFLIRPEQ